MLVLLLLVPLIVILLAARFGADTRDGRDWSSRCSLGVDGISARCA